MADFVAHARKLNVENSKNRRKWAIFHNFARKLASKLNFPKHTAYAIWQILKGCKHTGSLMKIVGTVEKKSPKNLQKWPKMGQNGHFWRFFDFFGTKMNFYGKCDTTSVSASSKYIKNMKTQKEKNIIESPAQKNTYSRCFSNVSPSPDF